MKARRFSEAGLEEFREYVLTARESARLGLPVPAFDREGLFDDQNSEEVPYELPEEEPNFATKLDIGAFITRLVPGGDFDKVRSDARFWTWLAALYFDQITKLRTKIKEPRAYIAGISFQEFYRHLILGPAYLYFTASDDPERVRVLLYDDPTTMNEVMVQFGSYQTLMQNKELQTVIQRLYFDEELQRTKRGSGGKSAGTPRRLMGFFRQIELNYDLASIKADRFWAMLPREFEKFK